MKANCLNWRHLVFIGLLINFNNIIELNLNLKDHIDKFIEYSPQSIKLKFIHFAHIMTLFCANTLEILKTQFWLLFTNLAIFM